MIPAPAERGGAGPGSGSTDVEGLRERVLADARAGDPDPDRARDTIRALLHALEQGHVRAAERTEAGWTAVEWVKEGILLAFRTGRNRSFEPYRAAPNPAFGGSTFQYADRDTLPLRAAPAVETGVRIVPGGTSVRAGAHLGRGVVVMPPAYVNIGAYVGEGTMVDSHALVGSCAQVGRRVHVSAGCQIGGVLEPVGLRPVIVEDEVLLGANSGLFEGVLVEAGAVVGPGVNLTASTSVFDLVRDQVYRSEPGRPLTIPARALVVPGSRRAKGPVAERHGIRLYAPVIVKYRDEKTDAATALEEALR